MTKRGNEERDLEREALLAQHQAALRAAEINVVFVDSGDVEGEIQGWHLLPSDPPGSWIVQKPHFCNFWSAVVHWAQRTNGVDTLHTGERGFVLESASALWRFARLAQAFPRVDLGRVTVKVRDVRAVEVITEDQDWLGDGSFRTADDVAGDGDGPTA